MQQYPKVSVSPDISQSSLLENQPVHHQQVVMSTAKVVETPKKSTSFFQRFFIIQEGVISLSVRDLTVVASLAITVDLLANLYVACSDQLVHCDIANGKIPMISGVICLPFWDRIFCLLTAFFAWTCHQVNIRAFYKKIFDCGTDGTNDCCMWLGVASVCSLPLIGFFDEHNFGIIHGCLAVTFFGCTGLYATYMAHELNKNKAKLPAEDQPTIKTVTALSRIMIIVLGVLGVSAGLFGSNYWLTPAAEWATGLLFLNFFAFVVYANPFYDSIHPYGKLVPPGTIIVDSPSQNTL